MQTFAQAYEENARVRGRLRDVVTNLSEEQLTAHPDGEKWSVQELVEHIAIVDEGISRICGKLAAAAKADGTPGDGNVHLSDEFREKSTVIPGIKVEAPERVRPTGQLTLAQSFAKMDETRTAFEAIRTDLEAYDLSEHKFPHPFFGDITAAEWFVLAGGHESRHIGQIERLIEKL